MTYDPRDEESEPYCGEHWDRNLRSGEPPKDEEIYVVTEDGYFQVQWNYDAKFWTGRDEWYRTDGEVGSWSADEILGWTDDYFKAIEASEEFQEHFG